MCGICGIAHKDRHHNVSSSLVESMCQAIVHRGPDDQGVFVDKNIGLGARRLSIHDLAGGHQPLANEDLSVWAAHNGEVYNFPDLNRELKDNGHIYRTRTDTETFVHAYEEWGLDLVHRLRGMFATAIWDKRKNSLLLLRDRIGIKPLYYTLLDNQTLVFGSEIKTILVHPQVQRVLEPRALDMFLTLEYIPAPFSIFKNIFKLPAGHSLLYQDGKIKIQKYWDLEPPAPEGTVFQTDDLEPLMDELYSLLKESVRLRLISDVPLGAFLSGGIDSSAIVGLMRELGVSPLKTFSIGFEDKSYNELEHARRIARKFDTEHQEFILRPQALELTDKLIHHLDEPLGDFSIFPTYLVSKMAREHVTVILSGDGGDEVFGGYEHYQAQKMAGLPLISLSQKMLSPFLRLFPPSAKKKGMWNKLQRFSLGFANDPALRHFRWMMFLSDRDKLALYSDDFRKKIGGVQSLHKRDPFCSIFPQLTGYDSINGELYLDLKTYLVDDILVKVDRMSMAPSLETRVPLIDHKIVEFIFKLPGNLKLHGWKTKWIFKKTMERLLPEENIYRSKEGFSIPIKFWLRTELKDLMGDYLSAKRISEEGLFNSGYIQNMRDAHLAGRKNFSHQLWALLVFEIWKETYM
ncbi:MAG: asparagine synthase (glutamine-hydrolyzing) [Candidatus Aminicenantes bacterium]